MKITILALFLIILSLLIITPKSWTQELVCEEVNGINWCYNPQACGQACNDVCAAGGQQPVADNTVWFEAQNTPEKCEAISQAFGLGDFQFSNFSVACLQDRIGPHTVGGGLFDLISCSSEASCPEDHRTSMDTLGVPCGEFSRRSICPCEPVVSNVPSLSAWGLIAMAGLLGIVGFMVILRRKALT